MHGVLPSFPESHPYEIFLSRVSRYRPLPLLEKRYKKTTTATVWLNQEQMTKLFERERSVITKHVRNVFAEGELVADSVCANFAHSPIRQAGAVLQP